jgi:hypothetical protein
MVKLGDASLNTFAIHLTILPLRMDKPLTPDKDALMLFFYSKKYSAYFKVQSVSIEDY